MAKQEVTLYLDDYRVRLLTVSGNRVTRWAEAPLEPEWGSDGIIQDQSAVAARIRDLLAETGTSPRHVTCGITGRRALTRPIKLPKLADATLTGLILSEARRVLPVAPEELYISWQKRPIEDDNSKIMVFLAAIPRDIADSYLSTLTEAGIRPVELQLRPLALAHLTPDDTAIIVDAQPGDFDIVVMTRGVPQPVRNIPFPAEAITPAERAMLVAEDLKRTIQFYNENNPETPLAPDLPMMVNADPNSAALRRELAALLQRPVAELSCPFEAPEEFEPVHFVTNLAIACQRYAPTPKTAHAKVRLNVLPEAYRPRRIATSKLVLWPMLALLTIASLLMLWQYISNNQAIDSMQIQLAQTQELINQRLAQKQVLARQIKTLEDSIAVSVNQTKTLSLMIAGHEEVQKNLETDLDHVVKALPSSIISLTGLTWGDGEIVVDGFGDTEVEVLAYAAELQKRKPDYEVVVTLLQFDDLPPVGESNEELVESGASGAEPDLVTYTLTIRKR